MIIINNKIYNYIVFSIILLFPLFYVIGSLFLNLLVVLTILMTILSYNKENKEHLFLFLKKYKYFILTSLTLVAINVINSQIKNYSTIKVISYLRFFIFPLCYIFLISKLSNKSLKQITYFYFFLISFVIVDSLIQLIFGKDIFGFPYFEPYKRITGPFGDEMIVGFFLLNIGVLTVSFLNYFNLIKIKTNFYILVILSISILLTGERSSFISFLIFLFFLFIFSNHKKIIILTSFVVVILSLILIKSLSFLDNKYPIYKLLDVSVAVDENKKNSNSINSIEKNSNTGSLNNYIPIYKWTGHFERSFEIIEKHYLFGSGFRTYRYICFEYQKKYYQSKNIHKCSIHPHNFHLEILSDNGILGYLAFVVFIVYIIFKIYKKNNNNNFGISIIFCLILSFIFPLKTTGSIFTTNFAFIFWYLVANYLFLLKKTKNIS